MGDQIVLKMYFLTDSYKLAHLTSLNSGIKIKDFCECINKLKFVAFCLKESETDFNTC